MGKLSEIVFGTRTLPPRAYLFTGTSSRSKIDTLVNSFGNVIYHQCDVFERYLVAGKNENASIMFQLYGAPIMCDLITVLKDGNVQEAFFFGYAHGILGEMRIGDIIVPSQVQTLDGVTTKLGAKQYTTPDLGMVETISAILERWHLPFRRGKSVSVPATFWHGDKKKIDQDVIALELEFAAFCHCTQTLGIKAGGIFIISDTKDTGLLDERPSCDPQMIEAFLVIKKHFEE